MAATENPADEIRRLRRSMNDLASLLALPAIWSGDDVPRIADTLINTLTGVFDLDLAYVRLEDQAGRAPTEIAKTAALQGRTDDPQRVGALLKRWLGDDPQNWPSISKQSDEAGEIVLVPMRLGMHGGVYVAGAARADFPTPAEKLLLNVAVNQAAIGLREARLLAEQKSIAGDLDRRVAQRTKELLAANEELKREIAERKAVEKRLREEERELNRSEAYLAEAQKLSLTGSFGWNAVTDEHYWSEETFRIFEYPPSSRVTLHSILDRAHPDDIHLARQAIAASSEGRDFDYEGRFLMPGGQVKHLHLVAHRSGNQDDRVEYIGAVQDVSQRRKSEETLSNIRSELAHVSRVSSLGALTASIAHEVNQPLAGIINNASTCLRMLGADPPNVSGALETARRTIRDGYRASDVITRLRALFGKKSAASELLDLNEAAQEVVALLWSELQRNRIIVRSNFAADLPSITGDRVQLQQVVLNLIRNAMDAMNEIADRPRELVITTENEDDEQVRLAVQDSGTGFDQQARDRLFHAFYTTKGDGMGIGLSVSRSIVESHGGRLWAELNDGPGATFSFSIPHGPARSRDAETAETMGITNQENAERRARIT